jgi:hypothetical protein
LVEALVEKKYPVIEEVDGRIYLHIKKKSAVDVALIALSRRYRKRVDTKDLVDTERRNGFSLQNAKMAISRIAKFVDNDGQERLRLLAPGLKRADEIISRALEGRTLK